MFSLEVAGSIKADPHMIFASHSIFVDADQ